MKKIKICNLQLVRANNEFLPHTHTPFKLHHRTPSRYLNLILVNSCMIQLDFYN